MQLKYIILTAALSVAATGAFAQNTPILTEMASAGTVAPVAPFSETVGGADVNVVKTFVPILPTTDAATINENSPANAVKQQVVYMDGTNQVYQSISKNVATVAGQAKHLVQLNYAGTQKDQFGFLPYGTGDAAYQADALAKQSAYYNNLYAGEGYTSFSKSVNTSSATTRSSVSYAPGKSQVGQSRGVTTSAITNAADEIRIWDMDASGVPVSTGYYAANELFGEEVIYPLSQASDPLVSGIASPRARTYTDKSGRLIAKLVADNALTFKIGSIISPKVSWLYTYYVYDVKGNLRTTITPKAYDYFFANSALNATVVNDLCFSNVYDAKGRVAGTHKPGEKGYTWAVYDRKNRLVMRQSPNETTGSEWEITFYDAAGKVKATSIYTDPQNSDHNQWQTLMDNGGTANSTADLLYYLCTDAGEKAYPYNGDPRALTSIIPNNVIMSYSWYDNYNALSFAPSYNDCVTQLNFTETLTTAGSEAMTLSKRTQGMLTASMVRVLRSPGASADNLGDWRVALNYYDDKGRVIDAVSFTDKQTSGVAQFNYDYAGTQYDFANRILVTKHVTVKHNTAVGQQGVSHTELNKTVYDANSGSPTQIWHKIDNAAWTMISSFGYDDMGRIKQKNIGNGGEIQDYTYNIRGQLTGINALYAETGNKQGVSRTFGESIKYDYGFTLPRYDGKMAGIIWRGASGLDMYAYGYEYTQNQALKSADFRVYQNSTWTHQDIDFSVPSVSYDRNGNITAMKQRGDKPGVGPVDMDNLAYTYNTNSNQLSAVTDNGVAYYGAGDFKNGTNTGADYEYDPNGNASKDLNRDVQKITFTRFNKPVTVVQNNGSAIEYSYDASGTKLEEIIKNTAGNTYKRTDYIGNCVYQNSAASNGTGDNLQYILTAEGRTVLTPKISEEFFVKDHLGNIRSVISVTNNTLTPIYQASYELANSNTENLVFEKINEVRDLKPGATPSNTMAARLNGSDPNTKVGTSLMVHVMAGDKVDMNVNSYYPTYNAQADKPVKGEDMMKAVIGTLTGGAGEFATAELHNVKLVKDAFSAENFNALENIVNAETDPAKPKAYLNYALFDEKMHLVKEMSGAFQANGENGWSEIGTKNAMEVPANGYLAVYLSNSSKADGALNAETVYFDQLVLQVRKGVLLEETHYYPFGLPIQGLSSKTASNFTDNRYKYQGNELIKDLDLNWMDFEARTYDPQLGRFMNVDPLAAFGGQDMFSPYAAMGNTPESNIDPNGLSPFGASRYELSHLSHISTDGSSGGGATRAGGPMSALGSIFGDAGVEGYVTGGGYDPGFSSMGMSSLMLNTFGNLLPKSMQEQVNADYESYNWRADYRNASNLDGTPGGGDNPQKKAKFSEEEVAEVKNSIPPLEERGNIVKKAYELEGSTKYEAEDLFGKSWKCNIFVSDVLTDAGASPGLPNGNFLKKKLGYGSPPAAYQWADPNYKIPGWVVVSSPQAGDVVATGTLKGGAHVAIMISPTHSMGANETVVHITTFGSNPNMLIHSWPGNNGYVYRRYVGR